MPYLAIEGNWKNFYDTKSQLGRKTLQDFQGRFPGPDDLNIEEHRIVDPWSHSLQEMIGVINRSSRENGAVAYSAFPRLPEFLRELTRRATKNGWLSLWMLRFKEHTIAMEYQLCADGMAQTLWAYADPAYREVLPAHILRLSLLQAIFERGCVYEYRMAPGSYDQKCWWATGSHETIQLKFYRPSLYSRLLYQLEMGGASGGNK
jgi:Acetyltransferase (GNAT) domain